MNQGFTLLWMGWQWDVPEAACAWTMPIATDNGRRITGLVRGNFIPAPNAPRRWSPIAGTRRIRSSIR